MNILFKILAIRKKIFKPLGRFMPHSKLRIFFFRSCGYSIGNDVFIGEDLIISDGIYDMNVIIKDRVSIAPRVTIVTSSGPNSSRISPYVKVVNGYVRIEQDAWIGAGAIILPNITIGEGAVIGAGAVVTKNVAPFTVVAGVPARKINKLEVVNETKS
jgi:acetyltransferase-like isoleucine patch superfamily enzyme